MGRGEGETWTFDVSTLGSLEPLGPLDRPNLRLGAKVGSLAYFAGGASGVWVYDLADRRRSVRLGSYDTLGEALGLVVAGTRGFVSDGTAGVQVLDVSNPAAIRRIGYFSQKGSAQSAVLSGDRLYVANGEWGLQILDVSNTPPPELRITRDNNQQVLRLIGQPGRRYRIDHTASLNPSEWSAVATPTLVESSFAIEAAEGFYRAVWAP